MCPMKLAIVDYDQHCSQLLAYLKNSSYPSSLPKGENVNERAGCKFSREGWHFFFSVTSNIPMGGGGMFYYSH